MCLVFPYILVSLNSVDPYIVWSAIVPPKKLSGCTFPLEQKHEKKGQKRQQNNGLMPTPLQM